MGASANRKPKTEANLQNDAVLGDLLGQIKTSATTKSDSKSGSGSALAAKPKLASSTISNQNSTKSHSNPFAVRPASTGLKKKCAPETERAASSPSVKGQLNSEWIYEVIVSPKMPTKIWRISALGLLEGRAEILQIFVGILGERSFSLDFCGS